MTTPDAPSPAPPYRCVDADRHTIEPLELWQRELPDRWKHHAPYYGWPDRAEFDAAVARRFAGAEVPALEPLPIIMQDGEALTRGLPIEAQVELALVTRQRLAVWWSGATPYGQVAAMDHTGFDLACLVPTWTSYLLAVDGAEPQVTARLARIYNEWLASYCAAAPGRLEPIAAIPRHDPAHALEELRYALAKGWTAIVTRPNPIAGKTLGHPDWDPLWAACAEANVTLILHEGTHAKTATVGADRFTTRFAQHACSHPIEHMLAFTSLLEAGVLERHPRLKIGFLEAGASWVPFWLHRLDYEFGELWGEVRGRINQKPSDYFKRQCWVSVETDEPLAQLIQNPGLDRLVFGTDYPHVDHALAQVDGLFDELGEPAKRRILSDNPLALYRP